jgi:CBS domain-containing protein
MNIIRYMQRKNDHSFLYDDSTVQQALDFLRDYDFNAVPVIDKTGRYLGTISESDILWHIVDCGGCEGSGKDRIRSFLRKSTVPALAITASDDEIRRAALRCDFVPIVDDRGMFVGIVSDKSINQYFAVYPMETQVYARV